MKGFVIALVVWLMCGALNVRLLATSGHEIYGTDLVLLTISGPALFPLGIVVAAKTFNKVCYINCREK